MRALVLWQCEICGFAPTTQVGSVHAELRVMACGKPASKPLPHHLLVGGYSRLCTHMCKNNCAYSVIRMNWTIGLAIYFRNLQMEKVKNGPLSSLSDRFVPLLVHFQAKFGAARLVCKDPIDQTLDLVKFQEF